MGHYLVTGHPVAALEEHYIEADTPEEAERIAEEDFGLSDALAAETMPPDCLLILNGKLTPFYRETVTLAELVQLSGVSGWIEDITATVRDGVGSGSSIITNNEPIKVKTGMIINVADTSGA